MGSKGGAAGGAMITVVSGSPRCGSSLMMAMLQAGGLPLYYDKGKETSWETDKQSLLPEHCAWLSECEGKAVKILEPCYSEIPSSSGLEYRSILMFRNPIEQAKSQLKFLRAVGGFRVDTSNRMVKRLAHSIAADGQPMMESLERLGPVFPVVFEILLTKPVIVARQVEEFLGICLDLDAMVAQVRKRPTGCLPGLLELDLIQTEVLP